MRKITLRTLCVVILALSICLLIIFSLSRNLSYVTGRYEDIIKNHVNNNEIVTTISDNMFNIESLLWKHVVYTNPEVYDECEEKIKRLQRNMEHNIDLLWANLDEKSDKELLHQVYQSYNGFNRHMETVLELSRGGYKDSARYYITNNMANYFQVVSNSMETMNRSIDEEYYTNTEEMELHVRAVKIWQYSSLVAALIIILVCIYVVSWGNKGIIFTQEMEEKNHQEKVLALQHGIIVGMANLIESRDGETGEHVKRTEQIVDLITKQLRNDNVYTDIINDRFVQDLNSSAPLHDIGKIAVPDSILKKPAKLSDEEFEVIKTHTIKGGEIILDTMNGVGENDYMKMAYDIALYHHERWDGKGYPEGLRGEEIPLSARIMAVADVFDALISKRCYKRAMSIDEAYNIIIEESGSHFDPLVVESFVKVRGEIENYLDQNK